MTQQAHEQAHDDQPVDARTGRRETPAERQDRKWIDQLQELRVMQTSAQLIAGFLLTLPFQRSFSDLTPNQERFYLALVLLAGLTTALVMSPVAIHRQLTGDQVKDRVVAAAHRLMTAVLVTLGLLVTGITTFIFDVVVADLRWAVGVGVGMATVMLLLLVAVPLMLSRAED